MKCTRPRIVHDSKNHEESEYPCGKCPACRRSRTREWANRIIHELASWKDATFITLTYEENPGTLNRRDLTLFIKRIRKQLEPRKIKYFGCGEYGERFGRPHYHLILFGVSPSDKIFEKIKNTNKIRNRYSCPQWPYGFIDIGSVTYQSAAYVAGYIQKKLGVTHYQGRVPPFQVQSKGIGLDYVNENKHDLVRELGFTMNGAQCSLPRYYRKKLDKEIKQERLNLLKEEKVEELDQFLSERGIGDVDERSKYKVAANRQREKEIRFKDEKNGRETF